MGMLTGIRVLTLLELAFWFIRFFSRKVFGPSNTEVDNKLQPPNQKKETCDESKERNTTIKNEIRKIKKASEEQNAIMEKKIRMMIKKEITKNSKSSGKKLKSRIWPSKITKE